MAVIEEDTPVASPRSPVIDRPAYSQEEEQRKSFIEVFNPFKRRQADTAQEELSSPEEKDPFSAALKEVLAHQMMSRPHHGFLRN